MIQILHFSIAVFIDGLKEKNIFFYLLQIDHFNGEKLKNTITKAKFKFFLKALELLSKMKKP